MPWIHILLERRGCYRHVGNTYDRLLELRVTCIESQEQINKIDLNIQEITRIAL